MGDVPETRLQVKKAKEAKETKDKDDAVPKTK